MRRVMSLPLVCVTLTGCTVDEMLKDAARATAVGADIVEVRLDKLWVYDSITFEKIAYMILIFLGVYLTSKSSSKKTV